MPLARIAPDSEAIAVDILLADAAVAAIAGVNVVTERAGEPAPLIRLFRVGGPPSRYIDQARLQLDSWGRTKAEANDLARQALRALLEAEGTSTADAVVTAVETDLGLQWAPDPGTDEPRYLCGVVLTAHSRGG